MHGKKENLQYLCLIVCQVHMPITVNALAVCSSQHRILSVMDVGATLKCSQAIHSLHPDEDELLQLHNAFTFHHNIIAFE